MDCIAQYLETCAIRRKQGLGFIVASTPYFDDPMAVCLLRQSDLRRKYSSEKQSSDVLRRVMALRPKCNTDNQEEQRLTIVSFPFTEMYTHILGVRTGNKPQTKFGSSERQRQARLSSCSVGRHPPNSHPSGRLRSTAEPLGERRPVEGSTVPQRDPKQPPPPPKPPNNSLIEKRI